MKHALQLPVGTILTETQARQYSSQAIINRELFDPKYSGYDPNFQWQDYISINVNDNVMRMRIIGSLNQFSDTPEGQHVIRQAAAMQAFRMFKTTTPTEDQEKRAKLPIVSDETGGGFWLNKYLPDGAISTSRNQIESSEFLNIKGGYTDLSVQHLLYHELIHSMDSLSTVHNQQIAEHTFLAPYARAIKQLEREMPQLNTAQIQQKYDAAYERFRSPFIELRVIQTTNQFMSKYFDELPRTQDHSAKHVESKATRYETQAGLGSDHYYDTIRLPPRSKESPQR